jgi:hypothetical protein
MLMDGKYSMKNLAFIPILQLTNPDPYKRIPERKQREDKNMAEVAICCIHKMALT